MVMRLKLASAACLARTCRVAASMTASVATKPSMVAMLGRIMPAPLLMPVTVTVRPPTCTWREAALGRVSVVMMPAAASPQPAGCKAASAAGRPASMRSTGRVSMITPVENGSTCSGCTPISVASAGAGAARALQTIGTGAGIGIAGVDHQRADAGAAPARCSRHTCTGAAQKRFSVNTPATALPSSSAKTTRSRRLALRTPAMATPMRTPGTGRRVWGSGADRLTGMAAALSRGWQGRKL